MTGLQCASPESGARSRAPSPKPSPVGTPRTRRRSLARISTGDLEALRYALALQEAVDGSVRRQGVAGIAGIDTVEGWLLLFRTHQAEPERFEWFEDSLRTRVDSVRFSRGIGALALTSVAAASGTSRGRVLHTAVAAMTAKELAALLGLLGKGLAGGTELADALRRDPIVTEDPEKARLLERVVRDPGLVSLAAREMRRAALDRWRELRDKVALRWVIAYRSGAEQDDPTAWTRLEQALAAIELARLGDSAFLSTTFDDARLLGDDAATYRQALSKAVAGTRGPARAALRRFQIALEAESAAP